MILCLLKFFLEKELCNEMRRSVVLPIYPVSMCLVCTYYRKAQQCEAFPRRIPQAILTGRFDHRKRHAGDHGVTFRLKEGVSREELNVILSIFDNPNP